MPLYEYKCKKCGHRFELIQTFSAEDAKECPVCQGEVERLISTPARAHFKGSGFYSTDYAAKPACFRPSRRMEAAALTAAPLLRTKVEPIRDQRTSQLRRQKALRLPPHPLPPPNRSKCISKRSTG